MKAGTKIMQENIVIRNVKKTDLSDITTIHIESFPNFFLSKLGWNFVHHYYKMILEYDKHVFLCYEADGEIIGFVSGFNAPAEFYRYLSSRRIQFIYPLILSVVKSPRIIVPILKNIRRIKAESCSGIGYKYSNELSSLAVNPNVQNKGAGKILVNAYLDALSDTEIKVVYLTTDSEDNEKVNAFYSKLGFNKTRTLVRNDTRLMNEYCYYLKEES